MSEAGGAPQIDPRIPVAAQLTPSALRILEVASQLFYDNGIHAIGVDTIVERSGITKRTLYNNFRSKEMLVAAYLRHRHEAWFAGLEERISDAPSPRALVLFDIYAEDTRTSTKGCAFLNAAGELPVEHSARSVILRHKHAVQERIRELIVEDLPRSQAPEQLARHLFLLLEGSFVHSGIEGVQLIHEAKEIARRTLELEAR